ncbi:hypothetical protein SAMN04488012_105129 [Palleronia salina]|uniref:Cytochrome c domain-containing protein n=1 Tax=Palleronia salina TaxID=313368 RepID=A0A1M6GXL1_9RHOB|nr:hypothetical protein [Palleronia salina]SHJ14686.1 hypothetical protein SAMN04488012_105129 [Palleronia salina]
MRAILAIVATICLAAPAAAELRVAVPDALAQSGVLDHLLPRFSLKTGVRTEQVREGAAAEGRFGLEGTPVLRGGGQVWHLDGEDEDLDRLLDWFRSDVGRRTIASFEGADFAAPERARTVAAAPQVTGDAAAGADLSLKLCGRCHVVGPVNRMKGLGSTPSFRVLRGLPGWQGRFALFFVLAPHAAFTQVTDVTPPFDPAYPPPIVPIELSLEDLEAITAFVAEMSPADLGAPIQAR